MLHSGGHHKTPHLPSHHFLDPVKDQWLLYQGQKLVWYHGPYGHKGDYTAYEATSGMKGFQNPAKQNKQYGPIPEGKYWISLHPNPDRIAKIIHTREGHALTSNKFGGIEKIPTQGIPFLEYGVTRSPDWGYFRMRLFPDSSAHTHGRTNFYIHDSHKGYTHGCIEVEKIFITALLRYRADLVRKSVKLALKVNYQESISTYGTTMFSSEIRGYVINQTTKLPEPFVDIIIYPINTKSKKRSFQTDSSGFYSIPAFNGLVYELEFFKTGFETKYLNTNIFTNTYKNVEIIRR